MNTQTVVEKSTTETGVTPEDKPYIVIHQALDFFLFLIEGLLLLDFALLASGANRGAGFFQLIHSIANIFMIPFRYLFPVTQASGSTIDWSILVAMVVYSLVFLAIRKAIAVVYTADNA